MELEAITETGNRLSFRAKGMPLVLANAIRRYSINHVPVMAIDKVTMYENSSPIFDEYIAHRIGMLPIKTPKSLPASAEVSFVLDVQGPKVVYAEELKSSDAGIVVAEPRIPIVTLTESQSIRLEGKAVLGIGRKHAKFQAGIASYDEQEDGTLLMKAESFLNMGPKDMLVRGCKALEEDLEELSDELGALSGKKKKAKKKGEEAPEEKKPKKPRAKKAKKEEKTEE
ncbi:MAG: DNA-directed RNA polymerase subunit D [Candidatus Micrarchaeota archaeon]